MDLSFNFSVDDGQARVQRRAGKGGSWAARAKVKQTAARKTKTKIAAALPEVAAAPAAPETVKQARRVIIQEPEADESPVQEKATAKNGKTPSRVISSLFSSREHLTASSTQAQAEPKISKASNAPTDGSFAALGLMQPLLRRISNALNLQRPTAVQQMAVPLLMTSGQRDFVIQAQTGSGKTLAYVLPIVNSLLELGHTLQTERGLELDRSAGTMAIVLVPTRELAQQVYQVAVNLLAFSNADRKGKGRATNTEEGGDQNAPNQAEDEEESLNTPTRWLVPGLLSGGMHRQHEKARLRKGVSLLIATPGRLIDHLETTTSFRIAGDPPTRRPKDKNKDSAEFDVEDQPFEPATGSNAIPKDEVSSDEDFESMAKSRSYKSRTAQDKKTEFNDPRLSLRWLVLDEADRLMDMGFEPQIQKIMSILDARMTQRKRLSDIGSKTRFYDSNGKAVPNMPIQDRTTVLCSATMEASVKKLAGSVLRDPVRIEGDVEENGTDSKNEEHNRHAPPAQLSQSSIIVPPKLRFVTLLSLLRSLFAGQRTDDAGTDGSKALVFLSCTDVVDFYYEALGKMQMSSTNPLNTENTNKLAVKCELMPNVDIYRLHGNLDMQTRINSLKAFAKSSESILLCTSLASRGLDVPFVRFVVQYDLPTEGGVKEYVHRVGRTARAGQAGESWAFVLPTEQDWLNLTADAHTKTTAPAGTPLHASPMQKVEVTTILRRGLGGVDQQTETRATDVQMAFERWVEQSEKNGTLAKNAFVSHVRAYATHPSTEKHIFHVKLLHLGHLAKSFGLREAPAGMGKLVASKAVPLKAGSKRKAVDIVPSSESEPDSDANPANKRVKQPKTGRAINAKRMHATNVNDRSEFSIGGGLDLERLVQRI